jgi:gluconate 5-dehydrogenase
MSRYSNADKNVLKLFDLTGRVALVIGGSGYLGTAISEALAECGAAVAIGGRDVGRAQASAQALPEATHAHWGVACDVANEDETRRAVDHVAERYGRLDILVTATVGHKRVGLNKATMQDFAEGLKVTLSGPFTASQQAAEHMRRAGGGSIIHIGSMYGVIGSYPDLFEGIKTPVPPAYLAAKGGLHQLTRHQAVFWAQDNIRVNCLAPGPFPPPNDAPSELEFQRRLTTHVPLGRNAASWEIKGAVAFLASDASTYVTGTTLLVDGGWTAW